MPAPTSRPQEDVVSLWTFKIGPSQDVKILYIQQVDFEDYQPSHLIKALL